MRFKSKVPGIEEMDFRIWEVALVGRGAGCHEDCIILAPDDQGRRFVFAEVGLPLGIQWDVRAIVIEQVELNLRVIRSVEDLRYG